MNAKTTTSAMCRPFVRSHWLRESSVVDILASGFPFTRGNQTWVVIHPTT